MCSQLLYVVQKSLQTLAFSASFFNKAGSPKEEVTSHLVSLKAKGKTSSGKKPNIMSFTFVLLLEQLIYYWVVCVTN